MRNEEASERDEGHPGSSGSVGDRPVVYVHIGSPKSGTTYLQNTLWRNRKALRRDGVLYPGPSHLFHFNAVSDLQNWAFEGFQDPAVPGAWDRLVAMVREWGGTSVVSHENLCPAKPQHIDRLMTDLDFAEVHVIYTARDLARQIPAAWQEDLKNRHTLDFSDYMHSLRSPEDHPHPLARGFWDRQDAVEILGRWGRSLPPRRVHVVTVPPAGSSPDLVWDRFAEVVGFDPARYRGAATGANSSMGVAESELLRQLNLTLGEAVTWPTYSASVKFYLAQELLAGRPGSARVTLPEDEYPWVVNRSKDIIQGLRSSGYDVVGDLDELMPEEPLSRGMHPALDESVTEQQLRAAIEGMSALIDSVEDGRRKRRELRNELSQRRRQPVKTIVRDLSESNRTLLRARVAWWHTVEWLQGKSSRS